MLFLIYFLGVIQSFCMCEIICGEDHEGHTLQDFLTAFAWPMFAIINAGALVWRLFEPKD
tara:strand:+ start:343 stop:522 length:180 start_codon:yes stop_codon:yes gene_type:complete